MRQSNLHVSIWPSEGDTERKGPESDSVMLLPRQKTLPAQVESLWAETLAKELPVASAVAARKELNASSRQDYWRRRRRMRRIEEPLDEEDGVELKSSSNLGVRVRREDEGGTAMSSYVRVEEEREGRGERAMKIL